MATFLVHLSNKLILIPQNPHLMSEITVVTVFFDKTLLLEPFLKFPFVPLPPHFLFGCCSPKHPHSNQTEMLADKVNSVCPSAPGPSPAGQAETTDLCPAASLGGERGYVVSELSFFPVAYHIL